MALVVQKYGGSSVATAGHIKAVARKIVDRVARGDRLAVVVSAMGDTTDDLISLAEQVSSSPSPREMDMLLSTGEQASAALLAMALHDMKVSALSLNAFQLGIETTGRFRDARIVDLDLSRLRHRLEDVQVVVITGFQGISPDGDVTTLGRGGSDTSAIAVAAKLGVPCEIYSDVAGIYACDPRVVPEAKKLDYVVYDEMLEMAALGARVLHSRGVEIAKKYKVDLYCGSTFSDEEGTRIVNTLPEWLEQPVVTGIAVDMDQMKVTLEGLPDGVDLLTRLFGCLAADGVNVDMISTVSAGERTSITFSVVSGHICQVRDSVRESLEGIDGWSLSDDSTVAKVSAVGVGMKTSSGVAARFFSALDGAEVSVLGTTTSEIKISVLVPRDQAGDAAKALVAEFDRREEQP
ncbi:aspartate kinase [Dethiosulfovibrio peptidovorans DSM 11002]|uniref:Aspartokinase n=1 Tax=Dethiosulfovibrio peptidovorans DSM 11002 TaxID=469381 RepID=D2Z763_9BACT|nr:aspartate kinase [Dethiosulfovibrio peptidovorans]EFC91310.1 aspartate kinase [Dethiosulfovibrio peptidovorans DSM 11002]